MNPLPRLFSALALSCLLVASVSAQVLFQDSLDSETGWTVVHEADPYGGAPGPDPDAPFDNRVTFGFDYSEFGIPEAPNTPTGDTATSGLQMIANLDTGTTNSSAAFPTGMNFTGRFRYQFDMWINPIGPFPDGGAGSTEFGGGGIGRDNSNPDPRSGANLLITGEAGSSNDIRIYAEDEFQLYTTHIDPETGINDLYNSDLTTGNANSLEGNLLFEQVFPGKEAPVEQLSLPGADQSGTTLDGALGFRWVTYTWTVDTEAGTARVQVTNTDTDETLDIALVNLENTYVDRDTIDEKFITSMEGNIQLMYRDLFTSVVDIDLIYYTFGVFDNVLVERILAGDFNEDGVVDAADYTVWRDNYGSSDDSALNGAGDSMNGVDIADYLIWKENFGETAGAIATATPEPASAAILGLIGLLAGRRRDR